MGKLNIYHRGFKDYRKNTLNNNTLRNERKAIKKSNLDLDVLNSSKYLCHIDSDWIVAIEEGLPFIDKAILEERQFIRTDGEIIPIEKVKKVSRASVEHLARHSDMITHVPEDEDEDLVPDKLMMVEKYSDYAVYENRFIYMLLSYLNEFIYFRLSKIEELRGTYTGSMEFKKAHATKNREYEVSLTLKDKVLNNPYPLKDEETDKLIERIKDCQQIVSSYLNRDLIVEVAKAPMIKPPIVKTNVLKMNNNFKKALALYEFISTYKGLGYTYEEVNQDLVPLNDDIADELSEITNLSLFLSFKHNNNLQEILDNEYEEEERLKRLEEEKELLARIERLKKKAYEDGKSLGEYTVLLEQRNARLERDSEELVKIKEEVVVLNDKITALKKERNDLRQSIENLKQEILNKMQEINDLNQKYITDINDLINKNELEIENLREDNRNEIAQIREDNETALQIKDDYVALKIQETKRDYEIALAKYDEDNQKTLNELNNRMIMLNQEISESEIERNNLVNEYESKVREIQRNADEVLTATQEEAEKRYNELQESSDTKYNELSESKEKEIQDLKDSNEKEVNELKETNEKAVEEIKETSNKEIDAVKEENNKLNEENDLLRAQISALLIKNGEMTPGEQYTGRKSFENIEKEYELFTNFYNEQWEITKNKIKNDLLSKDAIKDSIQKDKKSKKTKKSKK